MPMIRNKITSPVVLPVRGGEALTFMPRGDMSGADHLVVDDYVIESADFKVALKRDLLEVVPEEQEQDVIDQQSEVDRQRSEALASRATETIDTTPQRTIIGLNCLGPGPRAGQVCGSTVITEVRKGEPPLCKTHQNLAGQFYETEVPVEGSGDQDRPMTRSVWKRITVTEPNRL